MRKAAPRDKRCSGRAVGLVVAARCDMKVAVLRAPIVRMSAHCSEHQDDPSYQELSFAELCNTVLGGMSCFVVVRKSRSDVQMSPDATIKSLDIHCLRLLEVSNQVFSILSVPCRDIY